MYGLMLGNGFTAEMLYVLGLLLKSTCMGLYAWFTVYQLVWAYYARFVNCMGLYCFGSYVPKAHASIKCPAVFTIICMRLYDALKYMPILLYIVNEHQYGGLKLENKCYKITRCVILQGVD